MFTFYWGHQAEGKHKSFVLESEILFLAEKKIKKITLYVLNHTPWYLQSRVIFYFSLYNRCCWRLEKSFHWSSEPGNGCQIQSVLRRNSKCTARSELPLWKKLMFRLLFIHFYEINRNQGNTWLKKIENACSLQACFCWLNLLKQPLIVQLVSLTSLGFLKWPVVLWPHLVFNTDFQLIINFMLPGRILCGIYICSS